ncbi:leucine-rich repeat domain-containing protein [Frisingicoccus sp.]|uniref:leucine-rich repeat domain-containing protein n=1 Tax=Frisingicoccus sp. TaxID=1918627 RepID=UPI00399990F6
MKTMTITKDGVTYYVNEDNICVDIDVDQSVKSFVFYNFNELDKFNGFGYRDTYYDLKNVFKSFPNIKEITINNMISHINISNFMFPNVRKVNSLSYFFKSDTMLINNIGTLINSFCLNENEEIDMTAVRKIQEYAFEGCRSVIYVDDGILSKKPAISFSANSFKGSMIELQPLNDNHMRFFDGIAINAETNSDIVIIPDDTENVTGIVLTDDSLKNKTVIVNRSETLDYFNSIIPIKKLVLKADISTDSIYLLSNLNVSDSIELDKHNPYCKVKDNLLYSKNEEILYSALSNAKGDIIIPNGTKYISSYAFYGNDKIISITMPDSVRLMSESAFQRCSNLKYVRLSSNIKAIPDQCFNENKKLERVDCDGKINLIGKKAFCSCMSLKSIFSLEYCAKIDYRAFSCCFNLDTVKLANNTTLSHESLTCIQNIYIDSKNMLKDVLDAVLFEENDMMNTYNIESKKRGLGIVNIFLNDEQICIPRYMRPCDKSLLMENANILFEDKSFAFYRLFKNIDYTDLKQDLMFYAYKSTKLDSFGDYIKRTSKSIALRYIYENKEDLLLDLLSYNFLSEKALNEILKTISDNGLDDKLSIAKAYILEDINNKNTSKSSFRL